MTTWRACTSRPDHLCVSTVMLVLPLWETETATRLGVIRRENIEDLQVAGIRGLFCIYIIILLLV